MIKPGNRERKDTQTALGSGTEMGRRGHRRQTPTQIKPTQSKEDKTERGVQKKGATRRPQV